MRAIGLRRGPDTSRYPAGWQVRTNEWPIPAIREPSSHRIKDAAPRDTMMPTTRKLIAVVDDEAAIRTALDRQLRAAGFRCELFRSAEDFLAIATELRADCIVSDIDLGGMTGLELVLHPTV